jgi:hypothetical protein
MKPVSSRSTACASVAISACGEWQSARCHAWFIASNALRGISRTLNEIARNKLDEAAVIERALHRYEVYEVSAAFAEKRPPHF